MSNGYIEADYIAWLLAHEYGFAPYEPLKYEHNTPNGDIQSHFLANTSNVAKCLIQYDISANTVTGILSPDAAGVYSPIALHNGKNYYRRTDEGWFIWWDGVNTWNISTALGVQGDNFWTRTDPAIEGDYVPGGTAQGTPTVEPPNF